MYVTVAERDRRETERRRTAIDDVVRRLSDHAREMGGRYVLYGSAAKGMVRADSDIDILIDFPEERLNEAWSFAEDCARSAGIELDIMPLAWCKPEFVRRIQDHARSLP